MKQLIMKCTRQRLQWRRLIGVPAAMLLFVLSAQAQPTITAASNPVVVPSGQASGATTITWKAAPDYTYCEIYLSVDNGEWSEFARGSDGSKPATIKLGSSYTFRMMVYEGPQGTPKVITILTVTTTQGSPASPPSGSVGVVPFESGGKDRSDVWTREILDRSPFISDVRVQPDNRDVIISFNSTQKSSPLIEIGKVAPAPDRYGLLAFPFDSGAFSRFVPGSNDKYSLNLGTVNEQLDIGTPYYYIINVFNDNKNDARRPREQVTGKFTTLPQTVKVVWEHILLEDDSDDTSTGEITWWFWANYGQPSQKYSHYYNGDMDSGHNYYPDKTVVIENASDTLTLSASGSDYDGGGTPLPIDGDPGPPLNGPEDTKEQLLYDVNGSKGEFDLTKYPGNNVTVPFRLNSMPHGDLRFVIFGHFEITRGTAENTGTTSSALTPTPATPEPVKRIGRERRSPTTLDPPISICESARRASARNNAAAPGLEAQCRAAGAAGEIPPKATVRHLGRVEVPPGTTPNEPRPICEVAREARARNNAAAPGLEAQCRAVLAAKGAAIADADKIVAEARAAETDLLYQQGFDIATAIFGDPALGAQGNTATGPGSLGIRDSLTAAGQRGFNASAKLHISRKYKP